MSDIKTLKAEHSETIYKHFFPAWTGNGKNIICFSHEENNPSFSIFKKAEEYRHHCHACGVSGDCLDLIGQLENIPDAGHQLCRLKEIAGISSKTEHPRKQRSLSVADIQKIVIDGAYKFERYHTYKAGNPPYIKALFKDAIGRKKGLFYTVADNGLYVSKRKSESVLYNQEMLSQSGPVCFPEGEKDCNALSEMGLIAITNGSATDPLTPEILEPLRGRDILIFQDKDIPGREAAKKKSKALHGIAESIKVIELPGLPEKGDISDWIAARQAEGITAEGINVELRAIVKACPEWQETASKVEDITEWAEPVPFNYFSGLPAFPVNVLPDTGRQMILSISDVNQVDLGLTASNYLSVLSASLGKKAKINLISHMEPLNIFTCAIYDSGNRKSSTQGAMTKPLYEYQERMQEGIKEKLRNSLNTHRIREARLSKLQKQAANENDFAQRKKLEIEAAAVGKEIEENPVIKSPLYVMDDVTTEALAIHMAENNEAMSIFSTEGGIFQTMAGRYDKGVNIDLYLKAHTGDPFSVHRIGREPRTMQAPCLTMCLTVQPDVIKEIGRNEQFKGRGLLARFLYSLCTSQVGYRERQTKAVPEPILNRYRQHIFSLMEIPQAEHELRFTPDAQGIWDEFYNDVEADMRPGGSLEYLTDWGSKLPGAVARIAGLLHFAEHGAEAITKDISASFAVASCVIGGYFKDHALATFGLMQADHQIESAKKIFSYIKRQKPDTFKGRDVIANINAFKTIADDVMPGINILVERGYIRPMEKHHSGIGRPEAMTYEVNPKIKMECYKTTSNNSKSHALGSFAGFAGGFKEV